MTNMDNSQNLTFWEHLDVLRGSLIRIVIVAAVCGIAAFCFKDEMFAIVLAPKSSQFPLYRLMDIVTFDIPH